MILHDDVFEAFNMALRKGTYPSQYGVWGTFCHILTLNNDEPYAVYKYRIRIVVRTQWTKVDKPLQRDLTLPTGKCVQY